MSQSNAYSNPQRVVNDQFEIFRKARIQQQQMFQSTLANIQRKNVQKKKAQQYRYQQNIIAKDKMENSVSGFSDTGFDVFDNNIRRFWDSKVDDYFEIKNGISTGEIDSVRGKAALEKINKQMMLYKSAVEPVLKLATAYNDAISIEAGQAGSVSCVTDQDLQNILAGIAQGGDVNLVDRNGELFLYMPGDTPESGSSVQISDLLKLEANGKALTLTPKMDELYNKSVDHVLKPDNMNSPYFTVTFEENEKDPGNEDVFKTMSADQKMALKYDMNRMGIYSETVDNETIMNPLWADVYNDRSRIENLPNDFKTINFEGQVFDINDFIETDWQVVPEEIRNKYPDADQQRKWLGAQKKLARHLMVDKSVDDRIKAMGYDNPDVRKYVQTKQKQKQQATPYTLQTMESRAEDIDKIKTLSQNLNDNKSFVNSLNQLAGKQVYKERNGNILLNGQKLVFDFDDKKMIATLLAEAAGIDRRVINYALLPK